MRCRLSALLAALYVLLLWPTIAWAGMPLPLEVSRMMRLTESAYARFQAISFFLLILLVAGLVIRWLWNGLARDFPRLPRLSFGKALVVVAIWGLLFLVVLTMIAGTRELMTPGSWEKQGLLYRITSQPSSTPPPAPERSAELRKPLPAEKTP